MNGLRDYVSRSIPRTNTPILRRPKYFHIHLVMRTEASASTLQRNEVLLLQNRFLAHVALL